MEIRSVGLAPVQPTPPFSFHELTVHTVDLVSAGVT